MPPEGVRSVVSFLLFVHLFALAVGILANEVPSDLELTLGDLPGLRQYRQALWIDLPYTFYFTRGNNPGGEMDIDYTLVATVHGADGQSETIELPAAGMWPHQRFHRYQKLASQLAAFSSGETEDSQNALAQAIAGAFLRSRDARSIDLRCRGRLTPPAMEEYKPTDPTNLTRFRDAYEGRAFLSGDQVELLKKDPPRDTAPPPKDQ